MVKSSIILGAIPLAGYASALYIPHESDKSGIEVFDNANEGAATAQRNVIQHLDIEKHNKKHANKKFSKHMKKSGCGKNKQRKQVAHSKAESHHSSDEPARFSAAVEPEKVESNPTSNLDSHIVSTSQADKVIPDSYIVVLKQDAPESALSTSLQFLLEQSGVHMQSYIQTGADHPLLKTENGFSLKKVYEIGGTAFRGYAGTFLPEVAELLAQQPEVAHVERDSIVHTLNRKEEDEAPWGLARVSHRKHLGLGTYNKYLYDNEAGEGVTSYIVDTGIYTDHEDFEGRAVWGKTMPVGDTDTDAHGHGSHCAGTIGGKKYGVAKKAKLVAVKVLGSDGSGSMSDVIGGVEYVVEAHRKEQKEGGSKHKGSTANMSLGGGKSPSLDIAVNAATQAGVHFAVAAGNDNQDACYYSPAAAEGAVTVGATDVRDDRAYFSNYGKCVDIFAPGVNVLSVGTYSPSSSAIMSGTSMASPHVAGLLTYFLSLQPSSDSQYHTRGAITTKELKQHLIGFGTAGSIEDLDAESPNVLAYNGGGKDISDFWVAPGQESDDEDEDDHKPSFFDKIDGALDKVVDYFEDMVEESQELVGDLF